MRRRYRGTKRTTVERVNRPFSLKVFTFWDYAITDAQTAKVTGASIGTGFRVSNIARVFPVAMPNSMCLTYILWINLALALLVLRY